MPEAEEIIRQLTADNNKQAAHITRRSIEYTDLVDENQKLKERIQQLEAAAEGRIVAPEYYIDTRFFEGSSGLWITRLIKILVRLASEGDDGTPPLLSKVKDLCPLFLILKSNKCPHPFITTHADFAYFWNMNVYPQLSNTKLTCNFNTLIAGLNKEEWKEHDIVSWQSLALSNGGNNEPYVTAVKIKKALLSELEKIADV